MSAVAAGSLAGYAGSSGPELPAAIAQCLMTFQSEMQTHAQKMIQEQIKALHIAMSKALTDPHRASTDLQTSKLQQGGKAPSTVSNLSDSVGTSSQTKSRPNVSKDFKREQTIVFKKNQANHEESRISLTRQSIKNGGEQASMNLKKIVEGKPSVTEQDVTSLGPNPMPKFFDTVKGKPTMNIKEFNTALMNGKINTVFLDIPIDPEQDLPPPLFFAVGTKNEKLVKLLIEFRADARLRFQGDKMWNGVKKGMTALEAATNMKGRFIGTVLETKYEAIEEVLRTEEDRLRGWKSGKMVTNNALHGAKNKILAMASVMKTADPAGSIQAEKHEPQEEEKEEEEDEQEDEMTEEQERELEEKSKAFQAKLGRDSKHQKRHSVSLYTSKAAFVCQHVQGDPSDVYELGEKLGEGTFGYIRKAVHKLTKVPKAVKIVPKVLLEDSGLWQEIEIMRELDHPHIMKLFSTYEDHENLYIISELCSGGDLIAALSQANHFSEPVAGQLFRQMVCAVCYLHNQGICHRDLKPENFLLSMPEDLRKVHVKLIDFGAARHFGPGKVMTTKICALHYVAPELVSKKEVQYTEKCDVWSLGVVLYLMLCGCPPFWGDDDMAVLKDIRKGRYVFEPVEIWDTITPGVKDLISKMLVVDPNARFTAKEAAGNEWLKNLQTGVQIGISATVIHQMRVFKMQPKLKKIALQVIAQQIDDESIGDRRVMFDEIDTDSRGCLTIQQLHDAIKKVGIPDLSDTEIREMLIEVSQHSKDEEITYTQFLASTLDRHQYLKSHDTVRATFNVFDLNSQKDFGSFELGFLFSNNEALAAEYVSGALNPDDLVKEADLNDDGKIDFDEFFELMSKEPGLES